MKNHKRYDHTGKVCHEVNGYTIGIFVVKKIEDVWRKALEMKDLSAPQSKKAFVVKLRSTKNTQLHAGLLML